MYEVAATDAISDVINNIAAVINASNGGDGDPNLTATADTGDSEVVLTSKIPGPNGNSITYSATTSSGAQLTATAAEANLKGGGGAANVGPGTLVSICVTVDICSALGDTSNPPFTFGPNTVAADLSKPTLPTQMGGVEVYFNGIQAPLLYVSPTQINAQIPWEVNNTTSINAYVRSVMSDGSIQVTSPVAVSIVPANPGVFSLDLSSNPRVAVAQHALSNAHGVVSVDGTAAAGDTETVTVGNRTYTYTTAPGDTLDTIRDNLVALINTDPQVTAYASTDFDRIVLLARVAGPDGNGIAYGASASSGASTTITALGTPLSAAPISRARRSRRRTRLPPARSSMSYATGLGLPIVTPLNQGLITTGSIYPYRRAADGAPRYPLLLCFRYMRRQFRRRAAFHLDTWHVRQFPGGIAPQPQPAHQVGHGLTIAQATYVSYPATIQVQGSAGQ